MTETTIINPELATLIQQKFSTPIHPGNIVPVNRYNGKEKDIADAFTEYTPENAYTEPDHVSKSLASRAKGFDSKGIAFKKIAPQPLRASVIHALHLLAGGGILPSGVAEYLGKNKFKIYVIPNNISYLKHKNPEIASFLKSADLSPSSVHAAGGQFTSNFHHVLNNGMIHESKNTDIPSAHKETLAHAAYLAGRHLHDTMEKSTGADFSRQHLLPITKNLQDFSQAAQQLGFNDPTDLMGHLIRHYALSIYGGASELGDENHNIYGGTPIIDPISQNYHLLSFIDNLNGQHSGLGSTFYHILNKSGVIPDINVLRASVKGEPIDSNVAYVLGQSIGLPKYDETPEEDAAAAKAAKELQHHPGKINTFGTPRNRVVLAAKKKLAEYSASKAMKDHLNDLNINIHGPDSPHHILAHFKANSPTLPSAADESPTQISHSEISDKGRELNILNPTQQGEAADKEIQEKIGDEIGRHLYAKNGGYNFKGQLQQNSPTYNFAQSASILSRMGNVINKAVGLNITPSKEELENLPEYKMARGVSTPAVTHMMGTGAFAFNSLFKTFHQSLNAAVGGGLPNDAKTRFVTLRNFVNGLKQNFLQNGPLLRNGLIREMGSPVAGDKMYAMLQNNFSNILNNFSQIMQQYI